MHKYNSTYYFLLKINNQSDEKKLFCVFTLDNLFLNLIFSIRYQSKAILLKYIFMILSSILAFKPINFKLKIISIIVF